MPAATRAPFDADVTMLEPPREDHRACTDSNATRECRRPDIGFPGAWNPRSKAGLAAPAFALRGGSPVAVRNAPALDCDQEGPLRWDAQRVIEERTAGRRKWQRPAQCRDR
jgi:hypothetical protein